jgi:hypothetical protein
MIVAPAGIAGERLDPADFHGMPPLQASSPHDDGDDSAQGVSARRHIEAATNRRERSAFQTRHRASRHSACGRSGDRRRRPAPGSPARCLVAVARRETKAPLQDLKIIVEGTSVVPAQLMLAWLAT